MVKGIAEAVAALKREPNEPVTAEIDGLVVELRYKGETGLAEPTGAKPRTLADIFRELGPWEESTADEVFEEIGPWEGESEEELRQLLHEARKHGGSKEPPVF